MFEKAIELDENEAEFYLNLGINVLIVLGKSLFALKNYYDSNI